MQRDPSPEPAEHERMFGYRITIVALTAVEAARQDLGMIRSMRGRATDIDALPVGISADAAGAQYRELLG